MLNEGFLQEGSKEQKSSGMHENHADMRNPAFMSPGASFKYGQTRSSGSHPQPCRPSIISFDTEKYADIFLRLESLKNLRTEELPRYGEFVIRVMCMGQLYDHFPSGSVDLHSLAYSDQSEENLQRNPDISLNHEINFCIKFKDLVDNPLVLHLCHGGGKPDTEIYSNLPALGYICLDLGGILKYKMGSISEHTEPWIIPEKQSTAVKLPSLLNGLTPLLQLSIECSEGLPDTNQLLQGNFMTVFCESLHNLPAVVQQNVSYLDNHAEMQVFMTLPHSQTEPVLRFPGGKYRDSFLLEPLFRRMTITDETTQTGVSMANFDQHRRMSTFTQKEVDYNGPPNVQPTKHPIEPRHWASVKENSPETPMEATAMTEDTHPAEHGGDGELEIFGDGREDFMEFSETGEPRLVWNSIHRKYLAVDAYRGMLGRLSQNAVWPIEIAIAVKKKPGPNRSKKKTDGGLSHVPSKNVYHSSVGGSDIQVSTTNSNDSSDHMIMAELGQQASADTSDYTLIFHGLAFVDLSCLVHPGMKSARFSCRVYPFSSELLQRKTCVTASVLPEQLLLSLLTKKHSGDNNKSTTNKRSNQNQAMGNQAATNPVNKSNRQGSNQIDNPASQQEFQSKPRPSLIRKSDLPSDSTKKHLEEQITNEGGGGPVIERNPFIVFRISMLRAIVPCYKSTEISKVVDEYLPKRELSRRRLMNATSAHQKYKRAILEAASELCHEFSEHYWKDVLQNGRSGGDQSSSNAASNETLRKGFLFYLNASGRYLIIREHLRTAISSVVQQKCLNLRPSGFHNHPDFQSFLHDMYIYLVDEMNDILSSTTLQETDPLKSNIDRLLQQKSCSPEDDLSKINIHNRQITDLGIFAEESFAQGDLETCHKLHLQRICRDKESARCWTEFAIMWLARGDDRMAEIAVREALRKDPLHLYALLISGMISIRHGDERGLDCLGAALGLFPMAPEILVIVGMSNNLIGNGIAADYFFKKAAYVHRIITGQSVDDIEKLFTIKNAKKIFNMKQRIQDMDSGVPYLPENAKKQVQVQMDSPNYDDDTQNEAAVPRTKTKRSKRPSHAKEGVSLQDKKHENIVRKSGDVDAQEVTKTQSLTKERRKTSDLNNNMSKIKTNAENSPNEPLESPNLEATSNGPKFLFTENLNDILPEEVNLPLLSPSICSPYNITQHSEKLEQHLLTIDYLEKGLLQGIKFPQQSHPTQSKLSQDSKAKTKLYNNVYIPKDDGIAPDTQIKEEYDKIIKEENGTGARSNSLSQTEASNDGINNTSKSRKIGKRLSDEKEKTEQSKQVLEISPPVHTENTTEISSVPTELKMIPIKTHAPRLTDRLGTELIWAANLLLNLRLFDFVDGVLAKHLYFDCQRSVQFIYLRALSLHLRQREAEALPLIKEAIEYDNTNGMYYALEGHCYYILGNTQEAIASYENALRVPHTNENRHLLYLRYGSLVLDQGKSKIAKRVFLHGVSKYPTPYMWLALGSACFQRQEYDQAESAFAEANRLDSTNPICWGHLALSSLMQNKKALAEQSYKWAVRFGLKAGVLLDEIRRLQKEKGFGDPSFPRIPNCVPHEYYLRRMGRVKPFNLYKEGLNQDPPRMGKDRYDDTENEAMLKKLLDVMASVNRVNDNEEWEGENDEEVVSETMGNRSLNPTLTQSTGFKIQSPQQQVQSAPPDMMTTIKPPSPMPLQAN